MKILIISPGIYPHTTGGMEIYNYHYVNEITKLGHEVSLLTRNGVGITDNVRKYILYTGNPKLQSAQIIWHLIVHKYDIVHIPYCSNSFIAAPILKYKKINPKFNYVIYIHGGGMHKWINQKLQKEFFENSKEVIAISDTMVKEYEKRVNKEVKKILPLIPFGKPDDSKINLRKKLGYDNDETIMTYVGSIKKIKGSNFLIDSFIRMGKDFFNSNKLKIIFIGDGNLRELLQKKVNENFLSDEIIFLGKKRREDIPNYLTASDIFINASHFEGAPLSIIEALLNGLPVISTNVSGINNIIKNKINGLLFEKDNFESFNSTLTFALGNKELLTQLGSNAKNLAKKEFNYLESFIKHIELYR
ncbi:MAG: glycosyltransferase family 4 protein [Ignavibacteriaceae bacterium]